MIPPVVASERGTAQTVDVARRQRGCRTATLYANREQNTLENVTTEGDSPVNESFLETSWYPEYGEARETLSESAGTIR